MYAVNTARIFLFSLRDLVRTVVITAVSFFHNITSFKNVAKDSLPMPRQYKKKHFVKGKIILFFRVHIFVCKIPLLARALG